MCDDDGAGGRVKKGETLRRGRPNRAKKGETLKKAPRAKRPS